MTNEVVGVKATKTVQIAKYGLFQEGKTYFLSPEIAKVVLERNLAVPFAPKEKEADEESNKPSKKEVVKTKKAE